MDRLIYSSLAAMRGAMSRQATIGNNLANVNTAGFRGEVTHAQAMWLSGKGLDTRATVSGEVSGADMSAGAVMATNRSLDVAVDGDAMLTVQAADGSEAYTRRGDLQMSDSGLLTTGDGKVVMGEGGPITLPPYDSLSIGKDGTVSIVPVGGKAQDVQVVDRLKLVSPKGSQIAKGLDGLFHEISGGTLPADPDAKVTGGSLEGSNVNASSALIDMIDASRSWETQVKMLSTAQELDKSAADLMRLPD
ncbi:flagellar basal-body rod protein FlgF [Sphingomonas sp. BIUV-7]|uniref:Flagellar basal-body rod protein FlgF n=1 Tax=Sphingomonas natans TaxID=3063330 RepID=A0ABT8YDU7_9SPHN|nr:flagellar basal-body rod protein FlgF [Sphingomonas sp. BIUV-7]MDO6416551.1 flagellar basal-body rod protein FlgF [Sphingomonas sp. BIUV-7]